MSRYGWIMDRELNADGTVIDEARVIPVMGPRNCSETMIRDLMEPKNGIQFRLYDDDGNLNAEGRLILRKSDEGSELLFRPKDDYGEQALGSTEIHYKNTKGEWSAI